MRLWILISLLILVVAGFYFGVLEFDPLSFILLMILLINNRMLTQRQQTLAEAMSRYNNERARDQRVISKSLNTIQSLLRRNQ